MDVFDRIAGADPSKAKDFADRIDEGDHVLALKWYGERSTQEDGNIIAADFVVLESTTQRPGTIVGLAWFVNKGSWKGEKELARALMFVRELCGADDTVAQAQISSTMRDLASKEQPGTGMCVRAFGRKRKAKTTGNEFVAVSFQHIEQDGATIAATRAKLTGGAVETPAPAPVVETPKAATPSLLGSLAK